MKTMIWLVLDQLKLQFKNAVESKVRVQYEKITAKIHLLLQNGVPCTKNSNTNNNWAGEGSESPPQNRRHNGGGPYHHESYNERPSQHSTVQVSFPAYVNDVQSAHLFGQTYFSDCN